MGLSSTTNRLVYSGDGSSTIFSFPYYFFSTSDLNVFLYNVASSVITTQALNTNFTISGNVNSQGVYPSGGNVVMTSSVPTGLQIVIARNPTPIQNFSLLQNGPINSVALTQQLDYVTALVQRLQDEVSRCVHLPDGLGNPSTGTVFDPTLPSSVNVPSTGGAPLVTNSGATGFTFGTVATSASGSVSYLGILPVVNGGTGQGSALNTNSVIYAAGPTAMGQIAPAAAGQVLQSNGSSSPFWGAVSLSVGSGVISAAQGGTGASLLPTSGALIYGSGAVFAQLAGGTNNFVLVATASSAPVWQLVNLANNVSGVLPALNGGTGQALTPSTGGILFGSGAVFAQLSPAAATQYLTTTASGAPTWTQISLTAGVTGVLPMANGGVGVSLAPTTVGNIITAGSGNIVTQAIAGTSGFFLQSAGLGNQPTWGSALANPMTTGGDVIVGSSAGAAVRLPNGTIGQVLMSQGTTQIPAWQTVSGNTQIVKAPTFQRFTTKGNAQTYTLPTSPAPSQIIVELVGGGASGNGSGTSGGTSVAGSSTTWGVSYLVAGGGNAPISISQGGSGGANSVTGTSSVILINQAGCGGGAGGQQLSTFFAPSGPGGASGRCGGGGIASFNNNPGGAGTIGGGGGGGGLTNGSAGQTGAGGGGGSYLKVAITNSIAATYSFSIGAGGPGGATAGTGGQQGGSGGDGEVLVTEIY